MNYESFLKSAKEAVIVNNAKYFETKDLDDFNIKSAYYICHMIQEKQSMNEDGYVVIGLSGGKTPIDVYKNITKIKDIKIDYSKLIFFIVDERYKDLDHKFSNYNNIKFLFSSLQIDETTQLYRPDPTKDVVSCVLDYNEKMKNMINKYKRIDLVILGMGSDFHIAGLFPHVFFNIYMNNYQNNYIYEADKMGFNLVGSENGNLDLLNEYVYFTTTNNFDVRKRITVSLYLLQKADHKIFLLNSTEKLDLWKNMLTKFCRERNYSTCPAAYILEEGTDGSTTVVTCGYENYKGHIKEIYKCNSLLSKNENLRSLGKREVLNIIVYGCSGDLSQKKIYPALLKLFCNNLLPKYVIIIGFARTVQTFEEFFNKISGHLKKSLHNYDHLSQCDKNNLLLEFKKRCRYFIGNYAVAEDFEKFNEYLNEQEHELISAACEDTPYCDFGNGDVNADKKDVSSDEVCNTPVNVRRDDTGEKMNLRSIAVNRILYLALPPHIFVSTLKNYKRHCLNKRGSEKILLEKPFGNDLDSFKILSKSILEHFDEEKIYRIDHYLGKDTVLGLMKLKFTNTFLLSLMNRHFIKCIKITLKETKGVYGRGQYFDPYGIIRDVMQNHMLQLLTLITMEHPADLSDESVQNEKIKILKHIPPIKLEDTIVGQYVKSDTYEESEVNGDVIDVAKRNHSYHDDPHIDPNSITPTFCTCVLYINSVNWYGVPIIFKAGKGLNKDVCEIRIQFHNVMGSADVEMYNNEFVIILQPVEGIFLKMLLKKPGSDDMEEVQLNLTSSEENKKIIVPEAYETLFAQCMKGCKTKFISEMELYESWRIFTPLLNELQEKHITPLKYSFGSSGPKEVFDLVKKYYNYGANYAKTPAFVRESSYYDDDLLDIN